tara:strand:+ start:809 stop:2038 length:1230 start_codon:yes stop_codon:yes gene_type:complete
LGIQRPNAMLACALSPLGAPTEVGSSAAHALQTLLVPQASEQQTAASGRCTSREPQLGANSGLTAAEMAKANSTALPPLLFVKTHKTGSGTLANILHRMGDWRNLTFMLPDWGHPGSAWEQITPFPYGTEPTQEPPYKEHAYDIIANHAVYDLPRMSNYLRESPAPFAFTILRTPLTQAVSAYGYFWGNEEKDWDMHLNKLETTQMNEPYTFQKYVNSQAADLGWYLQHNGSKANDQDDAVIDAWIESLEPQLGLVMMLERFDEGLVLLRRRLGVPLRELTYLNVSITGFNTGGSGNVPPLTDNQTARLLRLNHVDERLHTHFAAAFEREWDSPEDGGRTGREQELQELQVMNAELAQTCESTPDACPGALKMSEVEYTQFLQRKCGYHRASSLQMLLQTPLGLNEDAD